MIANENDGNCPPTQAMQLYQRLKLKDLPTELVISPTSRIRWRSRRTTSTLRRLVGWFGRYLK